MRAYQGTYPRLILVLVLQELLILSNSHQISSFFAPVVTMPSPRISPPASRALLQPAPRPAVQGFTVDRQMSLHPAVSILIVTV